MPNDFVVMGVGQLGELYAAGALRAGYRVTPIRRKDRSDDVLAAVPEGAPLLVAVGESDLEQAVGSLPTDRHGDVILIQNELFPDVWQRAGLRAPSVAVPWVLKKRGVPVTVARTTPLFGKHTEALAALHRALDLPCETLADAAALGHALVSKFAFILTINVLGLARDISLGEWLAQKDGSRERLVGEAIALGAAKLGSPVEASAIRTEVDDAMQALASFPAKGRTARARLERALSDSQTLGIALPEMGRLV